MEISFLGGASEVGRSGILLKGSRNVLLDYGIKIENKTEYPMPAGKVDAFVLSHAHLDHSGSAPSLYTAGHPVAFGTLPTLKLSELLIEDSMKISRRNKAAQKFFRREFRLFQRSYVPHEYNDSAELDDYRITLKDAGHITGSALTLIENAKNERRILYTGDFKLSPQLLRHGAEQVRSNILITESTYATKEHPDRDELSRVFIEEVRATIQNKGTALIPVFAVGRAQEMLALLHKNRLADLTYIDGMAKKATEIVMQYPNMIDNSELLRGAMQRVTWVETNDGRHNALAGGNIILTTAGMLNGGPVLNYILRLNPASRIFLTGYQVETTNGRKLMDGRPIEIDGQKHKIRTPFSFYDFSAHSDKKDLYDYVRRSNPETVICVHGDRGNASDLAENLKLEGFDSYAPKVGDKIRVDF